MVSFFRSIVDMLFFVPITLLLMLYMLMHWVINAAFGEDSANLENLQSQVRAAKEAIKGRAQV